MKTMCGTMLAAVALAAVAEDETTQVLKTAGGGDYVCEKIASLPVACSEARTVEGREVSLYAISGHGFGVRQAGAESHVLISPDILQNPY